MKRSLTVTDTAETDSRRERAADTVSQLTKAALIGAAAAGAGWVLASAVAGTATIVAVIATVLLAGAVVFRNSRPPAAVWAGLAAVWVRYSPSGCSFTQTAVCGLLRAREVR